MEASVILGFKLKPAYTLLGAALVFAVATAVTTAFGGEDSGNETVFTPIDAKPPAAGIMPSELPGVSEALPPPPALVRLIIPSLQIDAPIVTLSTGHDGTMKSPESPFEVAWYDFSSLPGGASNVVLAGHVSYVDYGAAVFHALPFVQSGDELQLLLPDNTSARYVVSSIETYDATTAPIEAITGPTQSEVVTLITTAIPDDPTKRLVVRGDRVIEGVQAP